MTEQNKFGELSGEYNSARRGYPVELYEYLKELIGKEGAVTLDLGCGTGISTRELREHGFVVTGADKEAEMIEVAKQESTDIEYFVAPAERLPFEAGVFDHITAFTAFHWFNTMEALTEISRVLADGGIYFAAVKMNQKTDDTETFRKAHQAILRKYAGDTFSPIQMHFEKQHLEQLFSDLTEKSFYIEEKYTVEEALARIRSLSLWNLVAEEERALMMEELRELYEANLIDGMHVKKEEIAVISGMKKRQAF